MVELFIVNMKRLALLLPGIMVAVIATQDVYPLFDKRLPAGPATLITYILAAYIVLPTILRLIRLVLKPRHIPLYCTTPDGFASDPINIAVVGTREELTLAMQTAGWYLADKRTPKTIMHMAYSILFRKPYPTAPFSKLFLFGRSQDIGFQLPVDNNPTHRHHVRFWGVLDVDDPAYREHALFWKRRHVSPVPGKIMWIGAASKDIGLGIIRHNAQFTHMVHHDTDAERELIVKQLKQTGMVKRVRSLRLGKPLLLTNRVFSGWLSNDGKLKICELG